MGEVNYDWIEGIQRVLRAGSRLDPRWVEIIAYHAAIEAELNVMLQQTLPRGDQLTGGNPRFTFGHKVAVLKAAWKGRAEDADKLCDILYRFNELRNAVAHPDKRKTRAEIRNVTDAYNVLVPGLKHRPEIAEIAQGLVAYMGDGILPHDLKAIAGEFDKLVNVVMPKAFGTDRVEAAQ